MKSRYFEYAVYSSGMMLAGHFTFQRPVDMEHATKCASWEAQVLASEGDVPFDYADFGVVVKPVSKLPKIDTNTYWDVLKSGKTRSKTQSGSAGRS
jgi:hypothetical protein